MTLFYILGGTFLVSIISFLGVLFLFLKEGILDELLLLLVGLSTGAMMGGAFFHLIPEAVEKTPGDMPYFLILTGFVVFFLIEKVLHWHHCHDGKCDIHEFGYVNLIGDGFHNFLDGLIIAAAFLTDINLGIVTLIAIILHEIPQEVSDFGVLLYAGFTKGKALFFNFLSALVAVAGGLIGYFLGIGDGLLGWLLPFAAGGFIYIAAADLLPELKKEEKFSKFLPSFLFFLLGILAMYLLLFLK